MHLREKGGKERDALVLPDYADRVRKIFAKYSAKPSNSKYLLPLTALPKDMPLHVSTTLNIYAKVFDSTQMEAIGRVQASLENMLKESCSSSAQV